MFLTVVFLFLDWTGLDEDEDAHVWEDNWDDDNVEDDFSNQLRYFHFSVFVDQMLLYLGYCHSRISLINPGEVKQGESHVQ